MSKQLLSKFRRSLTQSSRIITDTPTPSSDKHAENHPPSLSPDQLNSSYHHTRQYLNNNPNAYDQLNLIKKIPELISQNDELKQAIRQMQGEMSRYNFFKRNSINFQIMNKAEEEEEYQGRTFIQKDYSINSIKGGFNNKKNNLRNSNLLGRDDADRDGETYNKNRLYRSNVTKNYQAQELKQYKQQLKSLKFKILNLQTENQRLIRQNKQLHIKYEKFLKQKQRNKYDIDQIISKFDSILEEKTQFTYKIIKDQEQKYKILEEQYKKICTENEKLQQENRRVRKERQNYELAAEECQRLRFDFQTMRQVVDHYENHIILAQNTIKINQSINHLWHIKQIQYRSLMQILNSMNQKYNK